MANTLDQTEVLADCVESDTVTLFQTVADFWLGEQRLGADLSAMVCATLRVNTLESLHKAIDAMAVPFLRLAQFRRDHLPQDGGQKLTAETGVEMPRDFYNLIAGKNGETIHDMANGSLATGKAFHRSFIPRKSK